MSKILLFSDAHVHSHKSSLKRLQHCLDALKWVFETAVDNDIKDVLFLGDLFQDREKIQVLPYQLTYEVLKKYCHGDDPKVRLHLLIGNHDMWFADKTGISSIYPFGSLSGVRIINKCETINIAGLDIDFLPFTLNPPKALEAFLTGNSSVLCGHIALDGAQLNTLYKTQADISVEYDNEMVKVDSKIFQPWKKVFLGHYHGAQIIKNVEYVGSPLQINFAEAYQEKHVIILDTDTLEQKYVVNTFSPQHLVISEDEVNDYDLNNAFVKIVTKLVGSAGVIDLKNQLTEKYDIQSIEFSPPKAADDKEIKITIENAQNVMVQDRGVMLEEYLKANAIPKHLDFDRLLDIGKKIVQKSQVE
jgi:DNA repair exonuclease SbcCD nuclease subunit